MDTDTKAARYERKFAEILNVKVVTYDAKTGEVHRERVIDFNDPLKRSWLNKTMVWALHHHHSVEIFNVVDDNESHDALERQGQSRLPV